MAFVMCIAVFTTSYWIGQWYMKNKVALVVVCLGVIILSALVFDGTLPADAAQWQSVAATASAIVLGISLYGFARLFARETDEERQLVVEFFKKLDTPIDVAQEVFGAGKKQVSTFPLVGGTTIIMGLLMSLILLTDITGAERWIMVTIITIMITFGALMWYFGKKSEIRSAAEYVRK
jgi:UDP-N-acetylmuramyl pentapeptide phosphotransferase/UDP-N-acetylglucosamine-1-phosphate transferase